MLEGHLFRRFGFIHCLRYLIVGYGFTLLPSVLAESEGEAKPAIGLQTWTCRDMSFEEMVAFAVEHEIRYLQLALVHVSPDEPLSEILRKRKVMEDHGLVPYSFGVNRTPGGKEANRVLFEFARMMGMQLIIVEPENMSEWDALEELVREYDINLAIHNHGTGTVYADPSHVHSVLDQRDERIGVCLDVGWVTEAGYDAAEVFKSYGDRVFDIHLKDKDSAVAKVDKGRSHRLFGEGDVALEAVCNSILDSEWRGVLTLEIDFRSFRGDVSSAVEQARDYLMSRLPLQL